MSEDKRNVRIKYSLQEIESYLEQWKSSGKSQLAFSKEAGLNSYTFNKWLSDSKRKSKKPSKSKQDLYPYRLRKKKVVLSQK